MNFFFNINGFDNSIKILETTDGGRYIREDGVISGADDTYILYIIQITISSSYTFCAYNSHPILASYYGTEQTGVIVNDEGDYSVHELYLNSGQYAFCIVKAGGMFFTPKLYQVFNISSSLSRRNVYINPDSG